MQAWLADSSRPLKARSTDLGSDHQMPAIAFALESGRCRGAPRAPRRTMDDRSLAAEVHVSRATVAGRFTELVGEPPLTYLTR
jgi:AraC-like DNA-binding protein